MSSNRLERIHQSVLDDAEASEQSFRHLVVAFAVLEGLCWGTYILLALMEFSLPVLIGVAAACVYATIAVGLFGLKFHMDGTTQRVLKAIEILAEHQPAGVDEST
jgi:threonine/homoserine efflux transporter RhtA